MKVSAEEIQPGLVLHLDPDKLVEHGATFTCAEDRRVRGGHFFICISVNSDGVEWLPVYSKAGVDREALGKAGRTGHSKWTEAECHYHGEQLWIAGHAAIVAAAESGRDMSRPGARNMLATEFLPSITLSRSQR